MGARDLGRMRRMRYRGRRSLSLHIGLFTHNHASTLRFGTERSAKVCPFDDQYIAHWAACLDCALLKSVQTLPPPEPWQLEYNERNMIFERHPWYSLFLPSGISADSISNIISCPHRLSFHKPRRLDQINGNHSLSQLPKSSKQIPEEESQEAKRRYTLFLTRHYIGLHCFDDQPLLGRVS